MTNYYKNFWSIDQCLKIRELISYTRKHVNDSPFLGTLPEGQVLIVGTYRMTNREINPHYWMKV